MRVRITYPPATYYHLPYLAPFQLKGHLAAATGVVAHTDDANVRFFHDLWSGAFPASYAGGRQATLSLELLRAHGLRAWRTLRDADTYHSASRVSASSRILRFADLAISYDSREHAATHPVPRGGEPWSAVVDRTAGTLVGQWVARDVAGGRYDDLDVACLSVAYLEQLAPALLLARLVKLRNPRTVVVVGGNALTHVRREVLGDDLSFWECVDYAVPFQGEELLARLLERIRDGVVAPEVDGVAHARDGAVVYRRALPMTTPPAGPPDFGDLVHLYPTPEPVYPLLTSKGCYWGKCAFCTHHEGYGDGYFRLGADALDQALDAIAAAGGRYLYFVDEAIPPREINALAERLARVAARAGGPDVTAFRWTAEARVDRVMLTDAAVRSLVDSGCVLLVNGIEAGSQRVVDLMRKGIRLDEVEQHAAMLKRAGIPVGWMFFIGFPGETEAESRATFEMIRRNRDNISFASVGTFSLERDSPIWLEADAFGLTLLDADVPYALSQNYRLGGTGQPDGAEEARQRQRLAQRLAALHEEFSDLDPVFQRAVDRSYAIFMADASRRPRPEREPVDPPADFWSESLNRRISVDLDRWKMRVIA